MPSISPATSQILKNSAALLGRLKTLSSDELEREVQHHNEAYFEKNSPEITDEAFDKLVEVLRKIKPDSPFLSRIGEQKRLLEGAVFDRVVHKRPMLSLDKCYDDVNFEKWREKVRGGIVAMPKIDGVALSIRYDSGGRLLLASTRGDGKEGENVTANVRRIDDIVSSLDFTSLSKIDDVEIRGEVYMSHARFNAYYAAEFANPRNLAAGALKQKEPDKSAAYGLSFFSYDIRGTGLTTEADKFELLRAFGFRLPKLDMVSEDNTAAAIYKRYFSERDNLDFEIDGVVFRANLVSEQERLGETAHHPRYAIAYKFQGESAQTQIIDVEWSVGRTGTITPVALIEPVFVSGATVSRASLHNWGFVTKLGLRKNTLVEVVRRGGVIPHVERVLFAEGPLVLPPSSCPSCHNPVIVDGDFIVCSMRKACPAVVLNSLRHYCEVVGIEGFGDKLLAALVERGLLKTPADLYTLALEDLLILERMGKVLATKLLKHVEASRRMSLETFITALGFEEIGPTVAAAIVLHLKTIAEARAATLESLEGIHGVGPSIASSFVHGMQESSAQIDALLGEVTIDEPVVLTLDESHAVFGKSFVFTGGLNSMDRNTAQKRVRDLGGKTPGAVSASTDYLVVGDDEWESMSTKKSSKIKTAQKLREAGNKIELIREDAFVKLLR
jgi:DNA ligase (NAD+)